MPTYRSDLPQTSGELFLTDGGLETTLIFEHGLDLPHFASFPLLDSAEGRTTLLDYYRSYAAVARDAGRGIVLETPTWRASADWGSALGYDQIQLDRANQEGVRLLEQVRQEFAVDENEIVISGNIGPRGDGYEPGDQMSASEAEDYHGAQIRSLTQAGADLITVLTMTYLGEAIGVAQAAKAAEMPSVISFTVETDGRLPTGQSLGDAVEQVDAATGSSPVFYGINCAHPDHFDDVLEAGGDWRHRIGLVRANASRMSHEELDNAEELDAGDPIEFGQQNAHLRERFPNLVVLGGCCGTDEQHVGQIGQACSVTPSRA